MKTLLKTSIIVIGAILIDACQAPNEVNVEKDSSRKIVSATNDYADLSVANDYEVRNGMFYFKDAKTFLKMDKSLREKTVDQRIVLTKQLGFVSLLELQRAVYSSLSEADNSAKYNEILASNKDIVQVNNGYISSIFDEFSMALLNRNGMVSIGGNIHCFAKSGTIISSSLDNVIAAFKTGKANEKTIIFTKKEEKKRFQIRQESWLNAKLSIKQLKIQMEIGELEVKYPFKDERY